MDVLLMAMSQRSPKEEVTVIGMWPFKCLHCRKLSSLTIMPQIPAAGLAGVFFIGCVAIALVKQPLFGREAQMG